MRLLKGLLVAAAVLAAAVPALAGVILQPYEAPEWSVSEWINGDPGPLKNLRGRVVIIEFFQLWCPGCNEFSIPLIKSWNDKWSQREDVLVVSIHTVFEGHEVQTPERLRAFVQEKGIRHPVGIDKYSSADPTTPITMNRFNTGGTPHLVIVDQEGELRFSHFGRFDPLPIEAFIERLTKESGGIRPGPRTQPPRPQGREAAKTRATSTRGGRPPAATRPGAPDPAKAIPEDPDPVEDEAAKEADFERAAAAAQSSEAPADDDVSRGSGSYQMQLQQNSKTCGTRGRPLNVPVDIKVEAGRITARFKERFAGLNQFAADFDPASGNFSAKTMRRSDEDGVGLTFNIRISGRLDLTANPPTMQFQYELDKEGDEPGWECKVSGNGSATRTGNSR